MLLLLWWWLLFWPVYLACSYGLVYLIYVLTN